MIRTWKCLLGAWAVCAILCRAGYSQVIEIDEVGVARMQPPATAPRPADVLYSDAEPVWLNDFQPPPGVGVDPVTIPEDNGVGYAVTSDVAEILYRIQRTNRHFHGLDDDGFTSAGAFVPLQVFDNGNALFAVDPRAFVSDNGRGGLNLGATFRRYSPRLRRVLVFSNWLDYDRAGQAGYAQYGLHAASIGEFWSIRGNINLPVGQSNEVFGRSTTAGFFENTIALTTLGRIEDAFGQYDVEVSSPIPYFARYGFEFGLGYYFLDGARKGAGSGHGVSTRVEAQVTENSWANALVTSDGVFGSNLSLNLEITLPNGAPSRIMRRLPIKQYLVQSDRRIYRVLRDYNRFTSREAAISTRGGFAGDPLTIVHIDPEAGPGGDGTFENPFGSIAEYESLGAGTQSQYEIIYVHSNTDESDTNLNTTVTLFDDQRLLGAGVDHSVVTQQGVFLLSATDATNPFLSNSDAPGTNVITLADNNEVSGFRIDASGGTDDPTDPAAAIAIDGRDLTPFDGGPVGVRDFDINRNTIQNSINGILIETETGAGTQTGLITENQISGFLDDGIQINASGSAQLALLVEDNDIAASGNIVGLSFLIDGNTFGTPFDITNSSAGAFDITGFTLDLTAVNAIWDSIEPGSSIPFQPQNATDVLTGLSTVNGNLITPGTDPLQDNNGVVLPGGGVPDDQPVLDLVFTDFNPGETFSWLLDSDFVGQPASTILGSDLIGADITVNFTGGQFLTGQLTGIPGNIDASEFVATGGTIAAPGNGDGVAINLAGSAALLAGSQIINNRITGVGGSGINFNGPGTSTATLEISDNVILASGQHGIALTTRDSEVITIFGKNNSVTGSGENGLHMETHDLSTLTVDFENSQFDENTGRGVKGASFDASTLNFSLSSPDDDLTRSSASNNGGPGLQFDAVDTSTQNIAIDDVFVDPNQDAGILVGAADDSLVNATITDSEIINTEDGPDVDLFGDGIFLRASGTAELNGLASNNLITGNAGHGFRTRVTESADLEFALLESEITGNGGSGIHILREGNSLLTGQIDDNIVDASGGNTAIDQAGIFVNTSGGNTGAAADSNLSISRNEFTNTVGGDGMTFITDGGSVLNVQARGNLVDSNEINGVRVTTNGGSFFGTPDAAGIGFASVFDSMTVTNNGNDTNLGAGYLLQINDFSSLVVDITSIEAAIDPDTYDLSLISGNFDGIRSEYRGFAQFAGDAALASIRVGTAFAHPNPDIWEVTIENNTDDAIDIDILNPGGWDQVDTFRPGGTFNMNVSDALIRGARAAGSLTDPGVEILVDGNPEPGGWIGQGTIATIVFGSDISDAAGPFGLPRGPVRDAVGGAFNNIAYARAGSVITDVAGDGVNVVYNNAGGALNLRFFDSIIGASQFGFNTEDGMDILVHNSGGSGSSGLDVILDNTDVIGNGGDGVRLRTEADFFFDSEQAFLSGQVVTLTEPDLTDSAVPPDGTGDTIFDGPFPGNGDSTSDIALNALPFVLDPPGLTGSLQNGWADLTSPDDFVADLQIINGSRIDNNGGDGVRLDIGTATRQRVSLQNSSFSGNGGYEISVTTFASFETSTEGEVDRTQPADPDSIRLDPTAKLDFYFGTLTAGGGPEAFFGVPAEFAAAVGGEGFNTSSTTRVNITYLSTLDNGFQTASTFKGAPRPASLFIRALIPDDPVLDDVDAPLPNRFLDFGAPFDEIDFFTDTVPDGLGFLSKYLQLNTP